jgi:hypothetical protein
MRHELTNTATDAGEQRVAELLGSLKRVKAPGDFDVRVRARIAQGRPAPKRSWAPVLVRAGVPAALVVVVGGYFAANSYYAPATAPAVAMQTAPIQVEAAPAASAPVVTAPAATSPTESSVNGQTLAQMPAKPAPDPDPTQKKVEPAVKQTPIGGSIDAAVSETKVIPLANRSAANTAPKSLPLKEALATAGVSISGMTVVSAPAGTGLRSGDQIVSVSGTIVIARRDGKIIQGSLKK